MLHLPRLLRRLLLRRRLRRLLPLRRNPQFRSHLLSRRLLRRRLRHLLALQAFSQVACLPLHPPQLVLFRRPHPLLPHPGSETIH